MKLLERRKQKRVNIGLPVTVTNGTSLISGIRSIDISRGGCLVDSPIALEPGTPVTVEILTELSSPCPIRAKVLRCEGRFWSTRQTVALEFETSQPPLMNVVKLESTLRHSRQTDLKDGRLWESFRRRPAFA